MKIKITENQAKRLKLINENTDTLSQFEQFCKSKVQELNNLYTKVTNLSIYEILHKEVNMGEIYKMLDKIENDLMLADKKTYDYINTLPEADLDVRIDKSHDMVTNRLTPLQIIVMDLEKLQSSTEEHSLTKPFSDIKPLDITNIQ